MKWKFTDVAFAFKKANASLCIIKLNVLLSWQSNTKFRRWNNYTGKHSIFKWNVAARLWKERLTEHYEVSAKIWETLSFNFTTPYGCTESVCVYLICHLHESRAWWFSEHIRAHLRVILFHLDSLWVGTTNKTNRSTNLRQNSAFSVCSSFQAIQCCVLINSSASRGKVR